jgi:hypothetical protein
MDTIKNDTIRTKTCSLNLKGLGTKQLWPGRVEGLKKFTKTSR